MTMNPLNIHGDFSYPSIPLDPLGVGKQDGAARLAPFIYLGAACTTASSLGPTSYRPPSEPWSFMTMAEEIPPLPSAYASETQNFGALPSSSPIPPTNFSGHSWGVPEMNAPAFPVTASFPLDVVPAAMVLKGGKEKQSRRRQKDNFRDWHEQSEKKMQKLAQKELIKTVDKPDVDPTTKEPKRRRRIPGICIHCGRKLTRSDKSVTRPHFKSSECSAAQWAYEDNRTIHPNVKIQANEGPFPIKWFGRKGVSTPCIIMLADRYLIMADICSPSRTTTSLYNAAHEPSIARPSPPFSHSLLEASTPSNTSSLGNGSYATESSNSSAPVDPSHVQGMYDCVDIGWEEYYCNDVVGTYVHASPCKGEESRTIPEAPQTSITFEPQPFWPSSNLVNQSLLFDQNHDALTPGFTINYNEFDYEPVPVWGPFEQFEGAQSIIY